MHTTDIAIVGGGPAGAVAARQLASRGYQVTLFEQTPFPRPRIGESIAAGVLPLLTSLELRDRIVATANPRNGRTRIHWQEDLVQDPDPERTGLLVDRGAFDKSLLEAAKEAGARIEQPASVTDVDLATPEPTLTYQTNTTTATTRCSYLIDASGGAGLVPAKRELISAKTLATYAYAFPEAEPADFQTVVEACEWGWIWAALLPSGKIALAIFYDADNSDQLNATRHPETFLKTAASFRLIEPWLGKANLTSNPVICDASSRLAAPLLGANWIKIGDAALTIDPLSSQGVSVAIRSAFQGATIAHTLAQHPQRRGLATAFYRQRQHETVMHHAQSAGRMYAECQRFSDKPFWRRRTLEQAPNEVPTTKIPEDFRPDLKIRIAPSVRFVDCPILDGEFITSQLGVMSSGLNQPCPYLGKIALDKLKDLEGRAFTLLAMTQHLQPLASQREQFDLARWLWEHKIITAAN